ncbi:MAG TPA: Eco57I restriction-modification methylase domain-containing protein [Flavobacterium sp.]|nr:Eco57I restriction-modification methylase domain-containing protein [Flavobacterium sp.]
MELIENCNEKETEEHHKNLVSDFLRKTYYRTDYFINTKGRNDLVIHNGKDAKTSVGVIIEAKSPTNKSEMIAVAKLNCKALQEAVLYYMRERITHKNTDLKYVIITNIYEWFIFDAQLFNKLFAENKSFVKQFEDFENKRSSGNTTDYFYKQIAEPFIAQLPATLEYTYFDIRKYDRLLRNADKEDDKQLIALYKLLSPEHLLKLSFANDSNSLDKNFYSELLHIIGLTETKEGGKKLIERNKPGQRHSGSMIENAILQLESMDKLSRLGNTKQYGDNTDERLFNVALELTITWVNRILFLKLLEAQLIAYQAKDKAYAFLNSEKIKDYDNLNTLFFQVLAKKDSTRNTDVQKVFSKVPYLNSSLFEMTDLEHSMFPISQLEDNKTLPLLTGTVIKDSLGKKAAGERNALHYFFSFLDAYDFASEGAEDIQEDNKSLINASVLGLIFEKINGYKDGSIFTPGFITMYMCRETIQKAVIQKFNEAKGWNCKTFLELQNQTHNTLESNAIINSLKICDPAVGSGHFLVSALNEIIVIKSRLEILCDNEGRRLQHYYLEVINDELIVTDDRNNFFQYNPLSAESRRVQEILFHEKETIIENCLFGVDINPNSVKICRLRLWIELLKNAYYKGPDFTELETLPNIDINIKSGNSLISRFPLDTDLKKALKESKWNIESYKLAVATYREADSKEQKRDMERLIADIKSNFRSEISSKDPKKLGLEKSKGVLLNLTTQTDLFGRSKKEETEWNKKVKSTVLEIAKLEKEIEEIKANKMFENAFEWRFEFPEVLDDDGVFRGFDAVIGNPPYIQLQKMGQASIDLEKMGFETFARTGDIYSLFYELGFRILKQNGLLTFITSNKWMRAAYGESLRKYFVEKTNPIVLIDFGGVQIFDAATVDTNILIAEKCVYLGSTNACVLDKSFVINKLSDFIRQYSNPYKFEIYDSWVVLSSVEKQIKDKIMKIGVPLKDWDITINYGIKTGYNEAFIITGEKRLELIKEDPKSEEIIRPILRGRDIKKYGYISPDLWLINTHNGIKDKGIKPIDISGFRAIKRHLDKYIFELQNRTDKGDTFYNLRNCAYMEDFFSPKIIWIELVDKGRFALDRDDHYLTLNGTFIMTGSDLEYITCILNNPITSWHFNTFCISSGVGTNQWRELYVKKLFIPNIPEIQREPILSIFKEIINYKKLGKPTDYLENELNRNIYDVYNLSYNEIEFIESL